MIDALQTAFTGMARATDRLGAAAQNIASAGAPVSSGTTLEPAAQVDLSDAAVELLGAKSAFALNAAVARTANRMAGQLLDINA